MFAPTFAGLSAAFIAGLLVDVEADFLVLSALTEGAFTPGLVFEVTVFEVVAFEVTALGVTELDAFGVADVVDSWLAALFVPLAGFACFMLDAAFVLEANFGISAAVLPPGVFDTAFFEAPGTACAFLADVDFLTEVVFALDLATGFVLVPFGALMPEFVNPVFFETDALAESVSFTSAAFFPFGCLEPLARGMDEGLAAFADVEAERVFVAVCFLGLNGLSSQLRGRDTCEC